MMSRRWHVRCIPATVEKDSEAVTVEEAWEPFAVWDGRVYLRRLMPDA